MKKTILSMLIAFGTLSADTLVLRDGSRITGTMLSANARTMSFVDLDGRRRDYSITNVQEISFGNNATINSRSRTETQAMPTTSTVDLVARLTDDIAALMDRATLSPRQRTMLEDSRSVLTRAWHDMREQLSVTNRREVQVALDNIRYVMNSTAVRPADRRMVLADIALLREKHPEFAGSASSSSGSRYRN